MVKEVTIPAGEVLTLPLLKRIDKRAYQYGGFKTIGGKVQKTAYNMTARTVVSIPEEFIKGDICRFLADFSTTLNAWYYDIKIR